MKMIRLLWMGVALYFVAVAGCGGGQVTPEPEPEKVQEDLDFQKTLE